MNPGIFFGGLCLAIGATVLIFGGRDLFRGIASKSWPYVEGSIASSAVIKEHAANTNTGFWLRASIHYTYFVKTDYYKGCRVRFVNAGTADAKGVIARYPEGKTVRIYYSPSNPSVSVLEPGANWFQFLVVPAALAFIAVGIVLISKGRQ